MQHRQFILNQNLLLKSIFSIDLDNYIQGGYNDYLPIRANDERSINLKKYIEFINRNVKAIQFRNYNK